MTTMNSIEDCLAFRQRVIDFWMREKNLKKGKYTKRMSEWKMKFILEWMRQNDAAVVLEIGTCLGVSASVFAYAVRHIPGTIYSIDIRDYGQSDIFNEFQELIGYLELAVYPGGNIASFAANYHAPPIDLLVIDGDHRRLGVKFDYEHFSPLVREGGLITFDDAGSDRKFSDGENAHAYVKSLGTTFHPDSRGAFAYKIKGNPNELR